MNGLPDDYNPVKGEWCYENGVEVTDRVTEEFFEDGLGLYQIAAVLAVKLRAYAALKSQSDTVDLLSLKNKQKTRTLNKDELNMIKDCFTGGYLVQYKEEIDYLCKKIEIMNPIFLKAVVNPGALRSMEFPGSYSRGSPEEAHLVLEECCRIFARIPFAHKIIAARYKSLNYIL